jgi:hypothetical protein
MGFVGSCLQDPRLPPYSILHANRREPPKDPLTAREQRKKTMGRRRNRRSFRYDRRSAFQLGRVVMAALLIILLVLILIRLLQ